MQSPAKRLKLESQPGQFNQLDICLAPAHGKSEVQYEHLGLSNKQVPLPCSIRRQQSIPCTSHASSPETSRRITCFWRSQQVVGPQRTGSRLIACEDAEYGRALDALVKAVPGARGVASAIDVARMINFSLQVRHPGHLTRWRTSVPRQAQGLPSRVELPMIAERLCPGASPTGLVRALSLHTVVQSSCTFDFGSSLAEPICHNAAFMKACLGM